MILTCKEFDQFMVDYLDGRLPAWQNAVCWVHIKMCRECAYFVRQYRRAIALGKCAFDSPDDALPDSVPEELIKVALTLRKSM